MADSPVLDGQQLRVLHEVFPKVQRIDVTFDAAQGICGALEALERIREEVRWDHGDAPSLVIINDRGTCDQRGPCPFCWL